MDDLGAVLIESGAIDAGVLEPVPPGRPSSRAELAADQLAAVGHHGGPVRVIAPAGSGKTRVLTERMRHVLADRGYRREAVIAVAYNKLAQNELETRLAALEPRTRTLNSLGYSLLNRHRGTRSRVLNEPEARDLIGAVFPIPRQRRTNTDPLGPYLDALTVARLGLVPPGGGRGDARRRPRVRRRLRRLPAGPCRPRRDRLRRADLRGARGAAARRRVPAPGSTRAPPPARRRVPGPDPGPRADDPPAGDAGLRRLRGRRRRSDDLRPRRGRSPLPRRLRGVLPRRRAVRPRGQLPLRGGDRRRRLQPARLQPRPGAEADPGGGRRRSLRRRARAHDPSLGGGRGHPRRADQGLAGRPRGRAPATSRC